MKKKSKLPVMYMVVCIYMVFSAFNLLEDANISWVHKISYALLILGPLGATIYSVWRRNVQLANSAYPATGWCLPAGIASALVGAALAALGAGVPGAAAIMAIAVVIAAVIVFFGVNGLGVMRDEKAVVYFDLPPGECRKIEKRCRYERFPKFSAMPVERSAVAGLLQGNAPEAAHALIISDAGLVEELKAKKLLAEQTGESRKEFPAFLKDPDNQWTGALMNPLVVAVDSVKWKKVREAEAQPLRSLETLLSPNLVGAFALPDAETSGAGRLLLESLARDLGGEEGREFYEKLRKNAGKRLADPIDYTEVFADDDVLVAVGFLHDVLPADTPRRPLVASFPDHAAWETSSLVIPRNTPNPEVSAAFAEFVSSGQGNAVLAMKTRLLPGHPKALVPPGSPPRADTALGAAPPPEKESGPE
ncbi:MAG: extracellular solute-binding protein [Planctomycetota bacterium]|nr:extracellular solute-binding protein [Planctomycetota bacterium]